MKIPHLYVAIRQWFQPYYKPNPKYYTPPVPKDEQPLTEKKARIRQKSQYNYVIQLRGELKDLKRRIKELEKGSKKRNKLVEKRKLVREEYDKELKELNFLREFLGKKPLGMKEILKKEQKKQEEQALRADEVFERDIKESDDITLEEKRKPKLHSKEYPKLIEQGKKWFEKNSKGEYDLKVTTLNYPRPLNNPEQLKFKPELNMIFAYHDKTKHQVLGHFKPQSGFRYKNRSNNKRKQLYPIVRPTYEDDKPFDRTHLIPFGYHNTENDMRLLIGWDSMQNRNQMNDFEQTAKNHEVNIYWLTSVEKTDDGAEWHYVIYDEDFNVLSRLDLSLGDKENPQSFIWKDGYYGDEEIWLSNKKRTNLLAHQ